ncbi:MAG: SpoIIE family protein phosphatase [Candidatus Eremiobacteraeota bacterium]|nr:SpoIIE family protein phosphatase [Candidatus Eremiobacteraeota bacterium]
MIEDPATGASTVAAHAETLHSIGEALSAKREQVVRAIGSIYSSRGFGPSYQERAVAIFDACLKELVNGGDAMLSAGDAVGLETLRWFEERGERFSSRADILQSARNDVFFTSVPALLEPGLREPTVRAFATFLTGYVRTINLGDSALTYQQIGLTVRRLSTARSVEAMARIALESTLMLLQVDGAWFLRRNEKTWTIADRRGAGLQPLGGTIVDADISGVDILLSGETLEYRAGETGRGRLGKTLGTACALLVPVMIEGECWGALAAGRRTAGKFNPQEHAIVEILGTQLSANIRKEMASRQLQSALDALKASEARLRVELRRKTEIANSLQQAFIPKSFPIVAGLSFDALYVPAEDDARIGGDWYDAFTLPDGTIGFSIGDVGGHGLEAAVTMGAIRQGVYAAALDSGNPAEVLRVVNRVACLQRSVMVTALVGFIDPVSQTMTYASAGHPPPIFAGPNGIEFLTCGGLPLGVFLQIEPDVHVVAFDDESLFVMYTDGLTEVTRDVMRGEKLVMAAVRALMARSDRRDAAATIYAETIGDAKPVDDVAILVVRANGDNQRLGISSTRDSAGSIAWDFNSREVHAAREVREEARKYLGRFDCANEDLAAAELVLGELLANTIEYAPGPVHVSLDCTGDAPVLKVDDSGPGFTFRARLPEPMSEGGRGLYLVSKLARELRVRHRLEGGTEVCAVLTLRCGPQ